MQFHDFKAFHEKILEKLGDIKDYKKVNWLFVTAPGAININLIYEVTFSKYKATCNLSVIKEGNEFSVRGDHFDSEGFKDSFMK